MHMYIYICINMCTICHKYTHVPVQDSQFRFPVRQKVRAARPDTEKLFHDIERWHLKGSYPCLPFEVEKYVTRSINESAPDLSGSSERFPLSRISRLRAAICGRGTMIKCGWVTHLTVAMPKDPCWKSRLDKRLH